MTEPTEQLIRLFAEESRVRAFAAVALGARSAEQVAEAAGLTPKEAAVALGRLREHGVVVTGDDRALGVAYGVFKEAARAAAQRERERDRSAEALGTGDARTDTVLRTFVRDGRLVRLPAQWTRKKLVLRHIAEETFEPGVDYPERTVDAKLRAWCEDSDDIDHVTLRRYLVDLHHLHRSQGIYRRPDQSGPFSSPPPPLPVPSLGAAPPGSKGRSPFRMGRVGAAGARISLRSPGR